MMIRGVEIIWAQLSYWPYASAIVVMTAILLLLQHQRQRKLVNALVSGPWRSVLLPRFSYRRVGMKSGLMMLGMLGLAISLLRPQWHESEKQVMQEGRDVIIALDISRSMLAQDMLPSRLEFAKKKIHKLLQTLTSERVGLIVFAGSACVLCPLTTDFNAFSLFLDQVDRYSIASGTTALDAALAKAIEIYERIQAKKTKLLVIFTDGEDFSSNLSALKKRAQEQQLHIFAMGVGTVDGAPIPVFDRYGKPAGHMKDEHDKVVISPLNEGILQALAADSGGTYLHAVESNADIEHITRWVQNFEKEQLGNTSISRYEDQYPWFVAVSFLSFLGAWIV